MTWSYWRYAITASPRGLRDCAQRPRAAHNYRLNEHLWCLISIGVASFAHVSKTRNSPRRERAGRARAAGGPGSAKFVSHQSCARVGSHVESRESRARNRRLRSLALWPKWERKEEERGRVATTRRGRARAGHAGRPGGRSSSPVLVRDRKVTGRPVCGMISDF